MMQAILDKNLAKVQQLIAENKGVSQPNPQGIPPLTMALRVNNMPIFQALLAAGSDPNAGEPEWSPLVLATQIGSMEAVQQLLAAHADPNRMEEGSYGMSALYNAVANGMGDMVAALLAAGANPNTRSFVYNPLRTALNNKDVVTIQHLLNAGVNPNVDAIIRHALIRSGSIDILRALLTNPKFQKDTITNTDFIIAAQEGNTEMLQMFLDAGFQLNKPELHQDSPLHAAALNGHVDTVRFLLEHDADPNTKNFFGKTPFTEAVLMGSRLPGDDPDYTKYTTIIQLLLENGANPNIADDDGSTPLHMAALGGNAEIAKILLDAGADYRLINRNAETARDIALRLGNSVAELIPAVNRIPAIVNHPNNTVNQNDQYNDQYDEEYNDQYNANENNNEEPVANLASVPPIPPEMNRRISTRVIPIPEETECFDPYMASTVPIAENQVVFYIFNKPEGNSVPTLSKVACIDNESEEEGQTIQLYRKFLDDITYMYYQCTPSVPQGAVFVSRDQTQGEPLRRLAFDSNIYVYESQARKIQAGRRYALIPTDVTLGRIVSETLLQTQYAVGAEHCQTDYVDKIYEIFEMVPASGGRKTYKRKKQAKQSKPKRRHSRR